MSASRDKRLILWNLENYEQKRVIRVNEATESAIILSNSIKLPSSLVRLATDKLYVASADGTGTIKIWEMNTERLLCEQENANKPKEMAGGITQMLFNGNVSGA